jgi:cytochrome P450
MDLMPTAVEEMIRWTTPVKEFMRTAAEDTTVRGVPIAKGESVYLAYVSGNRDEEVFDEPFRFDVGRDPNKHVAFGYGVHFCLGAALADRINSLYSEVLPRLSPSSWQANPSLRRPHSSVDSSTCRFATRCGSRFFAQHLKIRRPYIAAERVTRGLTLLPEGGRIGALDLMGETSQRRPI